MVKKKNASSSLKTSLKTIKKKDLNLSTNVNSKENDLKYLRYIINDKWNTMRHFFLKAHPGEDDVLIVANLPSYLPPKIVELFLGNFVRTPMTECYIMRSSADNGDLTVGQLTVHVRFASKDGVKEALKTCENVGPYKISDFSEEGSSGVLRKMIDKYRDMFSTAEQIQQSVDEYIIQQDESILQAKREAKRKLTEPDDDGWVTVTKAAKNAAPATKLKKTEIPLVGGLNKNKKQFDLAFYSYQARESKSSKAKQLQAKFEEDKKRIALLKSARKFKPI